MTVIVTFILAWGRYISNGIQFLLCTHHLASPFIFVCIIRQFNISSKPDMQFARLYDTIIIYYLYSSMVIQLENRVVKWQFYFEFCIWRIAIFARFFGFCLCLKKNEYSTFRFRSNGNVLVDYTIHYGNWQLWRNRVKMLFVSEYINLIHGEVFFQLCKEVNFISKNAFHNIFCNMSNNLPR